VIADLQRLVENRLPSPRAALFAGIIGDRPSQSAKSPSLWNAVFRELQLPVSYLAFDVPPANLEPLMSALRATDGYVGGNVTMPYKIAVMPFLDEVEGKARAIGAVNTIVRTADGRLIGYNTDGQGGLDALLKPRPDGPAPLESLSGKRVLLLGAGGAARALAFYLADALGPSGLLHVVNRAGPKALALAAAVSAQGGNAEAVSASSVSPYDVIVNASTVGQAGIRTLPADQVTCLEPFSPLAPADPPALERSMAAHEPEFFRRWMSLAADQVSANNDRSLRAVLDARSDAVFFDAIFAPLETVMLRQARLTGHRTLNGKWMSVGQAAEGFFNRVCRNLLEEKGLRRADTYDQIVRVMSTLW
jgi:shikimate dehydrogenase